MKNDNVNIIFFDTAPFIYLIENNPIFYSKVADFIALNTDLSSKFFTSVVSIMEFSVKPLLEKRTDLIYNFKCLLNDLNIRISDINLEIAELAASLRAEYSFLKGMDALQIATAINTGCSVFLTNDKKLLSITKIKIILIK